MKKHIYILIIMVSCTGISCSDFLDVYPETKPVSDSYYTSQSDFEYTVNAAYLPLQNLFKNQMWAIAEMRSDNTSYQYNTGDRSGYTKEQIDLFTEADNNGFLSGFFNDSYTGIARCNIVLEKIDNIEFDAGVKKRLIGEASFLRGYYYFNLVRIFGEIPLIDKTVNTVDDAFNTATREPVSAVYALIINDFKNAIENLSIPDSDLKKREGRATKGAANIFLAEVYMTQKDFAPAVPLLREITTMGYGLVPSYSAVFNHKNKNNMESIFEVQYMEGTNGKHSNFIYQFAPYNSKNEVISGSLGGPNTGGTDAGWNQPTQDLIDAYEPGDQRKDFSIGMNFTDPNNGKTAPYVNKWNSPHSTRYQTPDNWPVSRYADALLLLAECLNEAAYAADGEAFGYLNEVRVRAGLTPLTAAEVKNQEEFRTAIAHERQVELAFENHRWFDLLRTDKAQKVMEEHAKREKMLKDFIPAEAYQSIRLLYIYPQRESQLLVY